MNLIKWSNSIPVKSPFNEMFDDFFNTSLSDIIGSDFITKSPSVNIVENADQYTIQVAAPGMAKEDFNLELDKDQLIISSVSKNEQTEESDNFTRREYNFSSFKRSFYIPKSVDRTAIEAQYADGILCISLEKKEEAKEKEPTTIEIK